MEKVSLDIAGTGDLLVHLVTVYGLRVLGAVVLLVVGFMASKWLARIVYKALKRAPKSDETLNRFLSALVRYAVLGFTIIAVLNQFGVQTASLIAVLGALGLAIGLALQGTLSHVASGVMLLVLRPFKIGDYIEGGGMSGTVDEISLFTTTLNTPDNVRIVVPNGQIFNSAIKNWSYNATRRLEIVVGIDYKDNVDTAIQTAHATVAGNNMVLQTPEPLVVVGELADNSVNIIVRVWTKSSDFWPLKFALTKALKEDFEAAGLSIPFPQRTVHVVSATPEVAKVAALSD